ncbi:hypothetical protein OG21DRAFT_1508842 [Imleria badia]|nr:hypothetical protein OG21DRAFT_1508842 [Imleria badia]
MHTNASQLLILLQLKTVLVGGDTHAEPTPRAVLSVQNVPALQSDEDDAKVSKLKEKLQLVMVTFSGVTYIRTQFSSEDSLCTKSVDTMTYLPTKQSTKCNVAKKILGSPIIHHQPRLCTALRSVLLAPQPHHLHLHLLPLQPHLHLHLQPRIYSLWLVSFTPT